MTSSKLSRVGILIIFLAGLLAVVPTSSAWVERFYSRQSYLVVQNLVTPVSSLAPFAVFDLLLVVTAVALLGGWLTALVRAGRGRRWRATARMVFKTMSVLAGIYVVFLLGWGFNYRREPLTAKLDYDQHRINADALGALIVESVEHLNELHPGAHRRTWPNLDELPARLGPAFEQVQRRLGGTRTAVTGVPKASLLTPYFRLAGVDGMLNPFSLEVLVNETVLRFERPFVVAHEWAHLAGYADESEASFVGWLTCLAGDESSRYSGWLFLTPHLMRHLGDEERSSLWALMDEGPIDDLRAVAERLSQSLPIVQRNASRVYDRYLKANRVEAGIASYSAVVDLILGTKSWQSD